MEHDDLPSEQPLSFEYGLLADETRLAVQQRTNEIKKLMRHHCQGIINIGQYLIDVKKYLGHGKFRDWIDAELNWSVSATNKFMNVAKQFKGVNFTHSNITPSTLYLLAAPTTPEEIREAFLKRASNGEKIRYTEAEAAVSQHRKTASLKSGKPGNVIEPTRDETTSAISAQEDLTEKPGNVIEPTRDETTSAISAQEDLTEKEAQTEMISLSSPVVEQSENKLPEEKTEALANLHSNHSCDMALAAYRGNYSPKDQAEIEAKLVTVSVAAETVEVLSTTSAEPEPAQHTKPSGSPIDETAIDSASSVVDIQSLFEVGSLICITAFGQQDHKWLGEVVEFKSATATSTEVVVRIRPESFQADAESLLQMRVEA